jgi:hypothetical protein
MADFFDDQSAKNVQAQIEESLNITNEPNNEFDESTDGSSVETIVDDSAKEDEIVEKIKVGNEEYTQEELNRLVSLGKIGVEAEEKFNTKIDRVYPEYSKSRNEVKELKEQLEEFKRGNAEPLMQDGNEEQIQQAKEAAKRLGLMTADEFDQLYAERRASEKLLETVEGLESTYNGADGRPKFNKLEVLEYMRDNGINDPELAYKVKYEKELDSWKENRLTGAKKSNVVTTTQSSAGSKQPNEVRPTADNLDALVRESLGQ